MVASPIAEAFAGRVAVVTGSSGGIGAEVSRGLVAGGATVCGLYHRNGDAAAALCEQLGPAYRSIACDVTDDDAVRRVFRDIGESRGKVDILVNCAGGPCDGLLLRARHDDVRAALALNFESVVAASRAALPFMLKRRFGRIVSVSSVVASIGNAGQALYAGAKAGVEGFTRSLAREVGRRAITVNCVAPGFVATGLTTDLDESLKRRVVDATALGRVGTAQEVAAAVLFLASEGAGYVTGAVLHVNGGMYM